MRAPVGVDRSPTGQSRSEVRDMAPRRSLLLIADVGCYTEYMRDQRVSLAHAEVNTARLLGHVVDAAQGFHLIEIEGDAAFLSRRADPSDGDAAVALTLQTAMAMHRAFHVERQYIATNCVSSSRSWPTATELPGDREIVAYSGGQYCVLATTPSGCSTPAAFTPDEPQTVSWSGAWPAYRSSPVPHCRRPPGRLLDRDTSADRRKSRPGWRCRRSPRSGAASSHTEGA